MLMTIFLIVVVLICAYLVSSWLGDMPASSPPLNKPMVKWLLQGLVWIVAVVVILGIAGVHLP